MKKEPELRVEVHKYTVKMDKVLNLLPVEPSFMLDFSKALSTASLSYKIGDIITYENIPYRIKDISGTKERPVLYVDPEK